MLVELRIVEFDASDTLAALEFDSARPAGNFVGPVKVVSKSGYPLFLVDVVVLPNKTGATLRQQFYLWFRRVRGASDRAGYDDPAKED